MSSGRIHVRTGRLVIVACATDRRARFCRAIVATFMLLACQGSKSPQPAPSAARTSPVPEQAASTEVPNAAPSAAVGDNRQVPTTHDTLAGGAPESALEAAVERSNAASFALWQAMEHSESFVASPHSIRSALGLVYLAAAEGAGRDSFRARLMYPERNQDMDIRLLDSSVRANAEARFESANAIWVASHMALSATYTDAVSQILPAEVHSSDFVANPAAAQAAINTWVSEHTRGKIPELLQGKAISAATRAVLVNAVAFSGKWLDPFERERTSLKPFLTAQGETVEAQTMVGSKCLATFEESYQAAYAHYRDSSVVFVAVVPKRWQEFRWDAAAFQRVWGAFDSPQTAELELPRFSLRSRNILNKVLHKLGLDLRDPQLLRGLLETDEQIALDLAVHEAFFQVDETSTEAAAATAIAVQHPVSTISPPPVFRVDRAFHFLLVDRRTGLILFMGQVTNP